MSMRPKDWLILKNKQAFEILYTGNRSHPRKWCMIINVEGNYDNIYTENSIEYTVAITDVQPDTTKLNVKTTCKANDASIQMPITFMALSGSTDAQ